tara:strand:+ start:248 stop:715 length:468 start_codon:yes stop_codon:yes gene_type:complete
MKISNIKFLANIEEIKKLKYFYFQACDTNNLIQIKNTFASKNLSIDFEKFGVFTDVESFLEHYKRKSIKKNQIECHYGKNSVFKKSDNSIKGFWALDYYLFQTEKYLMTNITGSYEDLYVLEDNQWVIKESKFRRNSLKIFDVSHQDNLKKLISA